MIEFDIAVDAARERTETADVAAESAPAETCPLCGRPFAPGFPRGDYHGTPAHRLCAVEQELADLREIVNGLAARERV